MTHCYITYKATFFIHRKGHLEGKCPGPLGSKTIFMTPKKYYHKD